MTLPSNDGDEFAFMRAEHESELKAFASKTQLIGAEPSLVKKNEIRKALIERYLRLIGDGDSGGARRIFRLLKLISQDSHLN